MPSGYTVRISKNGGNITSPWYWEVIQHDGVIARGLAPSEDAARSEAEAEASRVARYQQAIHSDPSA